MNYHLKYVIDEQGLDDAVGLEVVTIKNQQNTGDRQLVSVREFKMTSHEGNNYTFEADVEFDEAGQFRTAVRMFPRTCLTVRTSAT